MEKYCRLFMNFYGNLDTSLSEYLVVSREIKNFQRVSLELGLLLKLLAKGVVNVTLLALGSVEGVTVVVGKGNVLLDTVDEVGSRDEVSAEDNDNILVGVFLLSSATGTVSAEATSNEDGRGVAPGINSEVDLLGRLDISVALDSGLDQMDVCELVLLEAVDKVGEGGDRVVHLHALEGGPRRQSDAGLVSTNGINNSLSDLKSEASAVLDAATPLVGTLVANILGELVDQVAVCAVNLNSVESCTLDGVLSSVGVILDEDLDLLLGKGTGLRRVVAHGNVRGRAEVVAILLENAGVGSTAKSPQLHVNNTTLSVDSIDNFLPGLDLSIGVNSRDVVVATSASGDGSGFSDDEGSRNARALRIVLLDEGKLDVIIIGAETRQGSHSQAV